MAYSNLNFGRLLHRIENINIKNNIRSYEKIKKRILSAKYGILFNQIYIYVYIYIYAEYLLRLRSNLTKMSRESLCLAGNLSDLTVASSQYDILLCSETLVSDMRHMSELLVSGQIHVCLVVPGQDASGPRDSACVRDGYGAFL